MSIYHNLIKDIQKIEKWTGEVLKEGGLRFTDENLAIFSLWVAGKALGEKWKAQVRDIRDQSSSEEHMDNPLSIISGLEG